MNTYKMIKMKTKIILFLVIAGQLFSQSTTLEKYIRFGLDNNLPLKQKNIAVDKAFSALKEAKGLFFPTIDFRSDLNYSDGGRKIDIPVGDMMNPVYSTLNQMTQSKSFPTLENQHIQLLPDDYQDTRLEVKLPLFNTDIWYNNKIKREAINQKMAETKTYKRELVKEIKTAYYNYIKTIKAISIYQNASVLLNDNYKLTESLVKNNMALKSSLLKLSADINKNDALLTETSNNCKIAASYFNFLLNRPLTEAVDADTTIFNTLSSNDIDGIFSVSKREELEQIKSGIVQNELLKDMNQGEMIPSLGAFAAVGYQGTKFKFDSNQRYYLLGLQLNWNLFNGLRTSAKNEQAEFELNSLQLKLEETEKQMNLQLASAKYNLNTAFSKVKSAKTNLEYSGEYYRQMRLRYTSGQALLLELTDALTQLVNNQMIFQLAITDVLIRQAELERAAARDNL